MSTVHEHTFTKITLHTLMSIISHLHICLRILYIHINIYLHIFRDKSQIYKRATKIWFYSDIFKGEDVYIITNICIKRRHKQLYGPHKMKNIIEIMNGITKGWTATWPIKNILNRILNSIQVYLLEKCVLGW